MKSFCLALVCALFAPLASAQMQVASIRVHVLNGHNGKPIRNVQTSTMMLPESTFSSPVLVPTDRNGFAPILAPTEMEIAVTVPRHATCAYKHDSERKRLGPPAFPVKDILATGVIGPDRCGHQHATPTPGVLTVYAKAHHWWHRFFY